MYVFVEIQIDVGHLVDCMDATIDSSFSTTDGKDRPHIYLLGTVQFRHALVEAQDLLKSKGGYDVSIPQAKPLSPGEVLGCTSPKLDQDKHPNAVVCFVADGRFHLESTLISNPHIRTFYRYDPYSKTLTEEAYDHTGMKQIRYEAIVRARRAQTYGIILGTLGRQGNPAIIGRIRTLLKQHKRRSFIMLLSEITPAKLHLFSDKVDAWVQVACPRLSVDWGHYLAQKPVLAPYELFTCLEETEWQDVYPMDYYTTSGGPWSNYYAGNRERQLKSC